jgi:tetratricopeptide (TPR) repeat protein
VSNRSPAQLIGELKEYNRETRGLIMLRVKLALILAPCAVSMAQVAVPQNQNGGGANNGNAGAGTGSPRPPATPSPDSFRAVYLAGRVLMSDGTSPSQAIGVQRICGTSITAQTHTDSKGRFNLALGGDRALLPDASSGGQIRGDGGGNGGGRGTNSDSNNWGCELRATLQGYRSDSLPINGRHPGDDPNVGTIILHPLGKGGGFTVSATTGFAPKSARRSYENGLVALRHNNPDDAQKDFLSAVADYPKFAVAWFELGRVYERRSHAAEARHAYTQAIAADVSYVNPYERLYLLDIQEGRWQQAADTSEKVIRLDPLEFPRAYYFNAVANARLRNLAAAERSAREATTFHGPDSEPRAHYVLAMILWGKGDFAAAKAALQAFLESGPDGPDERSAKRMLSLIEAGSTPKPSPPSA